MWRWFKDCIIWVLLVVLARAGAVLGEWWWKGNMKCRGWNTTGYQADRSVHQVAKYTKVDCIKNLMAHAQKPYFVFRRNGRVHLNRRGTSVQSTAGSRGVRISGSNAGYTTFRDSVKSTGYPLHSPVPPFPYRTTGNITVLYILIFNFLDSKLEDRRFCTE